MQMRHWHAAASLGLATGLQRVHCVCPQHFKIKEGNLHFATLLRSRCCAISVYVHLGGHSVCCCSALGGSFAPQFVCEKLGQAADSAVATAAARRSNSTLHKAASGVDARIEIIQALQQLFAAHGITTAFLGEEPAIVLHAEDSPASASEQTGSAAAEVEKDFATSHLVAWPLGAPESFRRHVEIDRLEGKAAQDYVPYVKAIGLYQLKDEALSKAFGAKPATSSFAPRASSLPDFAIQPLHDDVVAVVWGKSHSSAQSGNKEVESRTASFWKALSPDSVCSLISEFMRAQTVQDEDSLLTHQVGPTTKSVNELLYHPAALRAAGCLARRAELLLLRFVLALLKVFLTGRIPPLRRKEKLL
ncbi:hypothetical protein Emag_005418 [Eimeria magna]